MITYWHNPRCSKSRASLALLQDRGVDVNLRRYLDDPPTEDELRAVQALLGRPVAEMLRPGEDAFRAAGLSLSDPDDTLFAAMAEHPRLIERPIAFSARAAVIGRPPENVLALI